MSDAAVVAKGEESAEGAATEAATRAAAAAEAASAVGATAVAVSRTGSLAERGGATEKPDQEPERKKLKELRCRDGAKLTYSRSKIQRASQPRVSNPTSSPS